MAVLTPITSPARFTSGPPELPWLMAASVCRKRCQWDRPGRAVALMIPAVTVRSRPKGLPMARTQSPRLMPSELPSLAVASGFPASISITARSVKLSPPTSLAGNSSPEASSTRISSAPLTT